MTLPLIIAMKNKGGADIPFWFVVLMWIVAIVWFISAIMEVTGCQV